MPVSGNEEAGVKPFAWQQSTLDISGVPIKKRRFIRLPSPPPEEHSPPLLQKDAPQKEQSSPSEDSGSLVAGKTESSQKLSDATGTLVMKEMEGTCADHMQPSGSSTVIIEESSVVAHPGSLAKLDKEDKLLVAEKSADVLRSETAGLDSTHVKALIVDPVKELHDQQTEKGSKPDTCEAPGKMASSIGLEEHPVSDLEDHRTHANSGIHKSQGSVSLKLSLSNDESLNQQKLGGMPSNTENSNVTENVNVSANRSNWDLNTTMDTWEGMVANESKITSEIQDLKPTICSAEIGGTDLAIKSQLLRDSDCGSGMGSTISHPAQQSMHEHSLHLHLMQSFFSSNINQEPSSSSINKHLPRVVPHISLPSAGNANMSNSRIVKLEPFDESSRHDSRGACAIQLLNSKAVKLESIERLLGQEMPRLSNSSPVLNLIVPRPVKSEPFQESSPATYKRVQGLSVQSDNSALQGQDTRDQPTFSTIELQRQDTIGLGSSHSTDKPILECQNMSINPTCLTELSITSSASKHVKHDSGMEGSHLGKELPKEASESGGVIPPSKNSLFGDHSVNESIVIGMTDTATAEDKNAMLFEKSKQTFVGEVSPAQNNKDHLISNEEKINLSGDILEEDCYESEYDSDGNSMPMDIEEDGRKRDDIEDGEVQEQRMDAAVEGCISKVLADFSRDAITSSLELQCDRVCTSLHVEGTKPLSEDSTTTNIHAVKQYVGVEQKRMEDACKDPSVGESLVFGMPHDGGPEDHVIMTSQRDLLDVLREKDACKGQGTDNQDNSGGLESSVTVAQDSDENVKLHDSENIYFAMPKVEVPLSDDAITDPNNGGQRSRIINLSRASGEAALGKTRSVGSNTLTSYAVRERLPDGPLEGRGRSEICGDCFHKLPGERYQGHRNYRMNFVHGRGRLSSRSDSLCADKSSERNLAPEFNDCLSEYGVPRNKYVAAAAVAAAAAAAAEADVKFINHNVGSDGIFMASGRGRRKIGDDDENFHRLPSRRRSSIGRDGPAAHGVQMVRRVPRNINEDGNEVVGLRRSEKFVRGISNDGGERAYSRNQPPYEGLDSHFIQGTRNFSSIQRRAPSGFHSKSPIRSRSPVPWSSSKKRSPDAFDGPQDLLHRRSPIYRMDRMRSPDHPGFPAEMAARRQGSPMFLSRSNDLRELDSGWDHGHPRSMLPNRSPTGRVVIRNNRRFGIINHRERTNGNELFGGSMHSGRFHEVGDGDVEERRRYGERRGPVRSFRPPFNGSDGENFLVGTEDRPLRFFRDDDQQFHERVNLRERPFERGIKNRSGNQPRRLRGIEDQEGSYTEQGLYDEEQEDLSRLKRKRF